MHTHIVSMQTNYKIEKLIKLPKMGKKTETKKAFIKDRKAHNHDGMKIILVAFKSLPKSDQKQKLPKFSSFRHIIVKNGHSNAYLLIMRPFVIVTFDDHGVIILVMKKNPILDLHKPVPIIIVIEIFNSKNHLEINISHILNPNLTK